MIDRFGRIQGGGNVCFHTTSKIKDSSSAFCLNHLVPRGLIKKAFEKYPLFITYRISTVHGINHLYHGYQDASNLTGRVAQSVRCLATDACLTADPGVASSIPVRSHTFVEIDHEMIFTVILLTSADSFKKGCCQLQAKVCARITG